MAHDLSSVAPSAEEQARSAKEEPLLQPWQFFLLGGMLAATATVIVATGQSPANIIILSLTVVSVSFVGLGAYRMLLPLVSDQVEAPPTIAGRTRIALEREKTLVLRSIKELEFDHAMGKVAKADFDEMSTRLRARAYGLMKQLDAGGGYRDQIEAEIKRRLAGETGEAGETGPPSRPQAATAGARRSSPDLERAEADATSDTGDTATPRCRCGTVNDVDAKFCKNCGARL